MFDPAKDATSIRLASEFFRAGKPTATVSHGPITLADSTDSSGVPIFKNRRVAGFSNEEEAQAGMVDAFPFLFEDKINEKGGINVKLINLGE